MGWIAWLLIWTVIAAYIYEFFAHFGGTLLGIAVHVLLVAVVAAVIFGLLWAWWVASSHSRHLRLVARRKERTRRRLEDLFQQANAQMNNIAAQNPGGSNPPGNQ